MNKSILITGATGFVGSFLVEEAVRIGLKVTIFVRASSDISLFKSLDIEIVIINLDNVLALKNYFKEHYFSFIIHNAGLTQGKGKNDYFKINFEFTKNITDAIITDGNLPEKFIFTSSLAAQGPGNEITKEMIKLSDPPHPITSYGKSKLQAENYIQSIKNFPYIILRPTAVYGPREKNLLILFRLINKGLEIYIGKKPQSLSFIYVKDLVKVFYKALFSDIVSKTYFVTDGADYTAQDLSAYIKKKLNKKTIKIFIPLSLVRLIAFINEKIALITGNMSIVNSEKIEELKSLNWKCDIQALERELQFKPNYYLKNGVEETISWYIEHNLL